MTCDQWKTTNPDDVTIGPEPPPCELPYPASEMHRHPRYPSGYCVECGAEPHEGCKLIDAGDTDGDDYSDRAQWKTRR